MKKRIKLISVLLALLLTATVFPVLDSETALAADDDWVTVYKWTKAKKSEDLKSGTILLAWETSNAIYCSADLVKADLFFHEYVWWSGKELQEFTKSNFMPDTFFTDDPIDDLTLRISGSNDFGITATIAQKDMQSNKNSLFMKNASEAKAWTICGPGKMYYPSSSCVVPAGQFLFGEKTYGQTASGEGDYIEQGLFFDGGSLSDYNRGRNFYFTVYVCEPVTVHAITYDTQIESGKVVHYGDMRLAQGKFLTVKPQATLIIDGEFNNCGTIVNFGTVIVSSTGAVFSSDYDHVNGNGTFINAGDVWTFIDRRHNIYFPLLDYEGTLIIQKGGAVYMPMGFSSKFKASQCSVVVAGKLVVPEGLKLNNKATLRIVSGGELITGYAYDNLISPDNTVFPVLNKPEKMNLRARMVPIWDYSDKPCDLICDSSLLAVEYGAKYDSMISQSTGSNGRVTRAKSIDDVV